MNRKEAEHGEKAKRLVDLLGQLPDDLLEEAAQAETKQDFERLAGKAVRQKAGQPAEGTGQPFRRIRKHFGTYAACLCLLLAGLAVRNLWADGEGGSGSGRLGGGAAPETTFAGMEESAAGVPGAGGNELDGEQELPAKMDEGPQASAQPGEAGGIPDGNDIPAESGFWYGSCRYMESGESVRSALPEGYAPVGVLCLAGEETDGDWQTGSEWLDGCLVYGNAVYLYGANPDQESIFYVLESDGYHAYRPAGR